MKVLFFLPNPPPLAGPEIIAKEILDTDVIKNDQNIVFLNANIRSNNSDKGKFDLRGVSKFLNNYFLFLVKLITVQKVFLYLSASRMGFLKDSVFILTCRLLGRKCYAQYHGGIFHEFYKNQNSVYQRWIRIALTQLEALFVLGESLKGMFDGIYVNNIQVLHNGINTKKYSAQHLSDKKESVITILFIGHLWYPKGFYDLIIAYKELHTRYQSKIQLLFAGEIPGHQTTALEFLPDKWREHFLRDGESIEEEIGRFIRDSKKYNATHLGFITGEEKINIFRQSSIFVLPSYTEGFSMACLEAMAMGLPVIITPVGAMPEIVKHKINGLITPIGDTEQLTLSIDQLISNNTLRSTISGYNPKYIRDNFDINVITERLMNILSN